MAMLSGHHGDRPISRFLRDDADDLRRRLGWPRAAFPSNVAVRAALRAPDFRALSAEFRAWAAERLPDGELLALDAKAIRSTVVDHDRRRPRPSDAGLRRAGQRLRDVVRAGRGPGWSQSALVAVRAGRGRDRRPPSGDPRGPRRPGRRPRRGAGPVREAAVGRPDGDAGRAALHKKTLGAIADAGGEWLVKGKGNRAALRNACRRRAVGGPPAGRRSGAVVGAGRDGADPRPHRAAAGRGRRRARPGRDAPRPADPRPDGPRDPVGGPRDPVGGPRRRAVSATASRTAGRGLT